VVVRLEEDQCASLRSLHPTAMDAIDGDAERTSDRRDTKLQDFMATCTDFFSLRYGPAVSSTNVRARVCEPKFKENPHSPQPPNAESNDS